MLQNLYFYRSSRKIQYDTPNGPTTLIPTNYCFLNTEVVKTYNLIGVLGILQLKSTFEDSEYFLFVTKGEIIGKIRGHNVYSVEKIKYLPIKGSTTSAEMDEVKDFIETHSFYCTLDEIKECYKWNALLQQNFKKHIVKTNNSYSNKIVKSPFMHSKINYILFLLLIMIPSFTVYFVDITNFKHTEVEMLYLILKFDHLFLQTKLVHECFVEE